jgi:hypothetical protein
MLGHIVRRDCSQALGFLTLARLAVHRFRALEDSSLGGRRLLKTASVTDEMPTRSLAGLGGPVDSDLS